MDKSPKLKFTKGNNSKNKWNRVLVLKLYTALLHNVTYLCMKLLALILLKLCPVQDIVTHGPTYRQTG